MDVWYSSQTKSFPSKYRGKGNAGLRLMHWNDTHCCPKGNDRCHSDRLANPDAVFISHCHSICVRFSLFASGHLMDINLPSYSSPEWMRWTHRVFHCNIWCVVMMCVVWCHYSLVSSLSRSYILVSAKQKSFFQLILMSPSGFWYELYSLSWKRLLWCVSVLLISQSLHC